MAEAIATTTYHFEVNEDELDLILEGLEELHRYGPRCVVAAALVSKLYAQTSPAPQPRPSEETDR